ncbi:hypothetical protein [Pseudaminobacter sp. NGMCC 1.201702]|uniref:hypothetical protein n=1 Tax=Pseudaminobacter sp. NGMCC 1.201702 TaxID=3391825 RepID=UPI0039EEF45E
MAALALFDLLPDFGAAPTVAPGAVSTVGARQELAPAVAQSVPQPDISHIIRAEVERAEAELEARLAEVHAAALTAERERHAVEIEALMQRFGSETANLVEQRFAQMQAQVSDLATTGAARLLSGILSEDLRTKALDSLAGAIREATADREAVRIRVRGPRSLFEALCAALPDQAARFDYAEDPGLDLTVVIDGDIFETRLSEWSAVISEILA